MGEKEEEEEEEEEERSNIVNAYEVQKGIRWWWCWLWWCVVIVVVVMVGVWGRDSRVRGGESKGGEKTD